MSRRTNTSAFGLYRDRADVESAIHLFKSSGFRDVDLSTLEQHNEGSMDLAHVKHTKAPEGAVVGASVLGLLSAGAAYAVSVAGMPLDGTIIDAVRSAHPAMSTLSGLGAGMSLGALVGGLVGAAKPEYEAKRFQGRLKHGGILLSVHCDNEDWLKTALKLLKQSGAQGVGTSSEARADFATGTKPQPRRRSRLSRA